MDSHSGSQPGHGLGADLCGETLAGRYLLKSVLGVGGTATVFTAHDRLLRRRVAVKVLHPEYTRSAAQRRRVRQEAQLGAQLSHPNIVPIFDSGDDARVRAEVVFFIVMPLLEGPTLRSFALDGPLSWATAGVLVHQLLSGLATLHELGVIHRDIKLDNCMLVHDGGGQRVVLLDLGLAKVTRADLISGPLLSPTGRLIGTLPYISPEQALGEPLDARTDIYAAGVVLFELLAGQRPFVGTDYEVLVAHVEKIPPPPSTLAPSAGIPTALDDVTLHALAKRREERFPSADAFRFALGQALQSEGVDIDAGPMASGCDEAQASLAAWTCFEYSRARQLAELASKRSRAWSPLKLLMSLLPEE